MSLPQSRRPSHAGAPSAPTAVDHPRPDDVAVSVHALRLVAARLDELARRVAQ